MLASILFQGFGVGCIGYQLKTLCLDKSFVSIVLFVPNFQKEGRIEPESEVDELEYGAGGRINKH